MKLSVSLPEEDVATLDDYARTAGLGSRSAAIRHAVGMLRRPELEQNYAASWQEWEATGERAAWDSTIDDGLGRAAG